MTDTSISVRPSGVCSAANPAVTIPAHAGRPANLLGLSLGAEVQLV